MIIYKQNILNNIPFFKKNLILFFFFCFLLVFFSIGSMMYGNYNVSLGDIFRVIAGIEKGVKEVVIINLRVPRIVSAVVAGWGLSMAGILTQGILKNPLASPSTLGITHGAMFGASLSVILLGNKLLSISFFAFLGATFSAFVILILSILGKLSREAIILAGVALSSLFGAGTILVQYLADETQLATVVFWSFGDVARANWNEILVMVVVTIGVFLFVMYYRWDLNAFECGEDTALSLGINVNRLKVLLILVASLISAVITGVLGIISFVGLIAPHMARRIVGNNYVFLLPFSCVIGAILLLSADSFARIFLSLGSLPVGITTSFLGCPMFLYLLLKGSRWN